MGKASKVVTSVYLVIFSLSIASAQGKPVVAVLPFSVHSAENIEYVQQGILDMLSSRVAADDKIEVISKDAVLASLKETGKKELNVADVYEFGKKVNANFVIWGSITKIGNNVSIDGKLVDVGTYKSSVGIFAQSQGLDEIIPKINDFAQRITGYVLGSGPSGTPPSLAAPVPMAESSPQAARERQLIAGMRASKKGTMTSIPINPDFINAPQAVDRKGFWMSQQFSTDFKGMDIGDVNNDGLNEVVIIDSSNVMIYQKKGNSFSPVQQIKGDRTHNYLAVDVADINDNGTKEIFVTNLVRTELRSFVLEWRDGKFVTIASNIPRFLRVINDAAGTPMLLGQELGSSRPFELPIHEMVWDGKGYREGKRMKIPQGLSIFGLTLDTLSENGPERVIAFDEDDRLVIYEKTEKALSQIHVLGGGKEVIWKSDETFGGSNTAFSPYPQDMTSGEARVKAYANIRILAYDTNNDKKKELFIVKNISPLGGVFRNTRMYTSCEIYNLEYDGLGLSENWRTRKINGYVADYQFKDIDNDGQNEIVLAVVLSVGVTLQEKSAIVAYKLVPQESAGAAK